MLDAPDLGHTNPDHNKELTFLVSLLPPSDLVDSCSQDELSLMKTSVHGLEYLFNVIKCN